MIVRGNTGGTETMGAAELAGLLNADATFRYHCEMIDLVADVTPGAIVGFSSASGRTSGIFVGGYEIVTEETDGVSGGAATSSGMAMTGRNADGERLVLQATETGSQNFVRVYVAAGSFRTYCPLGLEISSLAGTDVVATVNGIKAQAEGNRIKVNSSDLALEMDVANEVAQTRFTLTGGGCLFQLGTNVQSTQQIRIALGNMSSSHLGGSHGKLSQLRNDGDAALTVDSTLADLIVRDAISTVTTTRGRIGAVQRSTLDPNILALQDGLVTLTEREAQYTNADFAEEASRMSRAQILLQAGSQVLAIANQQTQYAARLVG